MLLQKDPEKNVIQSDTLQSTTIAGVGAAFTGLVGVVTALLPAFSDVDVPDSLKVAGIGLIGLGALAWAVATAGDAIARAYATAHVKSKDGGTEPALPKAVERLAEAYENASLGIPGEHEEARRPAVADALVAVAGALTSPAPPAAEAANGSAANGSGGNGSAGEGPRWMPAPRGIHVIVDGLERPVAALVVAEDGATVRALWLDADGRTHLVP